MIYTFLSCSANISRGLSAYKPNSNQNQTQTQAQSFSSVVVSALSSKKRTWDKLYVILIIMRDSVFPRKIISRMTNQVLRNHTSQPIQDQLNFRNDFASLKHTTDVAQTVENSNSAVSTHMETREIFILTFLWLTLDLEVVFGGRGCSLFY